MDSVRFTLTHLQADGYTNLIPVVFLILGDSPDREVIARVATLSQLRDGVVSLWTKEAIMIVASSLGYRHAHRPVSVNDFLYVVWDAVRLHLEKASALAMVGKRGAAGRLLLEVTQIDFDALNKASDDSSASLPSAKKSKSARWVGFRLRALAIASFIREYKIALGATVIGVIIVVSQYGGDVASDFKVAKEVISAQSSPSSASSNMSQKNP